MTISPLLEAASVVAPILSPTVPARLVPVGADQWRVVDPRGRALGHIRAVDGSDGTRFRARRFHAASGVFRDLGDFWSCTDAVECVCRSR